MQNLPGRRLGKYLVDAPIARGGMAWVYRGQDTLLNRPVALKVLDPALTADPASAERFRREAVTAANLQHPNIVPVYDVREDEGLLYTAMRYVPGETLRDRLTREGALPLDETLRIVRAVAAALTHAHRNGVVHRDVKPGNILLEPNGNVLLTDFGIARTASQSHLTQTGQVLGTVQYMAPELLQGLEPTTAADTYALGIVLYEMLTGKLPFDGTDLAAVMYRQVHGDMPSLHTGNPAVDAALEPIVAHALAKSPALRYATPDDLAADLAQAVRELPASPPLSTAAPKSRLPPEPDTAPFVAPVAHTPLSPPAPTPRATAPLARPAGSAGFPRSRWVPLAAVGALLLIGLLGLGLLAALQRKEAISNYAAAAPASYTGRLRQNTGDPITLRRALRPPTIDGKLTEWDGATAFAPTHSILPNGWSGPADLSALFHATYDDSAFYLAVVVTDELHVQNTQTRGIDLWKGDDVELWFDQQLNEDFDAAEGDADDWQVGLSAGDFAKLGPEAFIFRPPDHPVTGIRVAAQPRTNNGGYVLEVAIPWAAIGGFQPHPGQAIGFAASVGDNDSLGTAQQTGMLSTARHLQWNHPPTFGNLFF
jgi:hypothetical protein